MINQVRHTGIVVQNIKNVEKFYCSLGFIKSEQSFEEGSFIIYERSILIIPFLIGFSKIISIISRLFWFLFHFALFPLT